MKIRAIQYVDGFIKYDEVYEGYEYDEIKSAHIFVEMRFQTMASKMVLLTMQRSQSHLMLLCVMTSYRQRLRSATGIWLAVLM